MSVLHVVMMTAGASTVAMEAALADVSALRVLPGVEWLHAGPDTSIEGLQNGYTHVIVVSFATPADRDAYLRHPSHVAAGARLGAAISSLAIVDLAI
ncbi:Dabb family protein [Microbacterium jepli]|uniref:Dabb family protein n=1 Tax=Microbacterium sp. 1P10UE TaxID=3132288 RepID=UPI00399F1282